MAVSPIVIAGAWIWEKYGQAITDKTSGVAQEQWNKFKWKAAAEKYRIKLQKLYGTMQIMGMSRAGPTRRHLHRRLHVG